MAAIGQILRQRYKIIKKLGEGGIGETYLAEDLDLPLPPKRVVKQLQPIRIERDTVRLFEQEAKVLQRLGEKYEQIPTLYASFQENQQFYLIQEFIEGHDLSQELAFGKRWREDEVIQFLREILEILAYVHQNQVIHRDINPNNIMRRKEGKLVLIDFGAVKEVSTLTVTASGETRRTIKIGTQGYMPSEQAIGKPKLSSDIYAVGMTAIQGLTGILPEQILKNKQEEVIWREQVAVSDQLAKILNKMVRYDFRQRYQDATEVLQVLNRVFPISQVSRKQLSITPVVTQPSATIISSGIASLKPKKIHSKYGYVDQTGRVAILPNYQEAGEFTEGLAKVKINNKYGYIDESGRCVIQPQFDDAKNFSNALADVKINNKWHKIDKTGRFVDYFIELSELSLNKLSDKQKSK